MFGPVCCSVNGCCWYHRHMAGTSAVVVLACGCCFPSDALLTTSSWLTIVSCSGAPACRCAELPLLSVLGHGRSPCTGRQCRAAVRGAAACGRRVPSQAPRKQVRCFSVVCRGAVALALTQRVVCGARRCSTLRAVMNQLRAESARRQALLQHQVRALLHRIASMEEAAAATAAVPATDVERTPLSHHDANGSSRTGEGERRPRRRPRSHSPRSSSARDSPSPRSPRSVAYIAAPYESAESEDASNPMSKVAGTGWMSSLRGYRDPSDGGDGELDEEQLRQYAKRAYEVNTWHRQTRRRPHSGNARTSKETRRQQPRRRSGSTSRDTRGETHARRQARRRPHSARNHRDVSPSGEGLGLASTAGAPIRGVEDSAHTPGRRRRVSGDRLARTAPQRRRSRAREPAQHGTHQSPTRPVQWRSLVGGSLERAEREQRIAERQRAHNRKIMQLLRLATVNRERPRTGTQQPASPPQPSAREPVAPLRETRERLPATAMATNAGVRRNRGTAGSPTQRSKEAVLRVSVWERLSSPSAPRGRHTLEQERHRRQRIRVSCCVAVRSTRGMVWGHVCCGVVCWDACLGSTAHGLCSCGGG